MSGEAKHGGVKRRFTVLANIGGFEVIDDDGRPVEKRETKASANGFAYRLNQADAAGTNALQGALTIGVRGSD